MLKIRYRPLKADVGTFTRDLHKNMTKLFNEAVREFVKAALPAIHIDTGMSRASVLPLARAVRMLTGARSAIRPQRGPQKGAFTPGGTWRKSLTRGPDLGEEYGKRSFTLTYGTKERPIFRLDFDIRVYQWSRREAMWAALVAGQRAFYSYVLEHWPSAVPRLTSWIKQEVR
jgi:hypothetical protein